MDHRPLVGTGWHPGDAALHADGPGPRELNINPLYFLPAFHLYHRTLRLFDRAGIVGGGRDFLCLLIAFRALILGWPMIPNGGWRRQYTITARRNRVHPVLSTVVGTRPTPLAAPIGRASFSNREQNQICVRCRVPVRVDHSSAHRPRRLHLERLPGQRLRSADRNLLRPFLTGHPSLSLWEEEVDARFHAMQTELPLQVGDGLHRARRALPGREKDGGLAHRFAGHRVHHASLNHISAFLVLLRNSAEREKKTTDPKLHRESPHC